MQRRSALAAMVGLTVASVPRKRPVPKPKQPSDEWRECQACHGLGLQCEPLYLLNELSGLDPQDIIKYGPGVFTHNGLLPMHEVSRIVQSPTRPARKCPACDGAGGRYHRRPAEEPRDTA